MGRIALALALALALVGCYHGPGPQPRRTSGTADAPQVGTTGGEAPAGDGTDPSTSTTPPSDTSSDPATSESSAELDATGGTSDVDTGVVDGDSESEAGSTTSGAVCPEGSDCFLLEGVFHVADEDEPTAIYDIDLPANAEYRVVEVELDVTHGGWYADDPAGLHNIFWLHRGTWNDFTWMGGVVGYVNARGPGNNVIRTRHDLDASTLEDSRTFNINGVALQQDITYHVFFRYDAEAGLVTVRITDGDETVAEGTDVPTADAVRNTDGGFFIYFANGTDVEQPGPEVPSLGWSFADLRVEFIP